MSDTITTNNPLFKSTSNNTTCTYKSSRRMIDCDEAVVDVEKNTS